MAHQLRSFPPDLFPDALVPKIEFAASYRRDSTAARKTRLNAPISKRL